MSEQLREFLQERRVAVSRTTPYNPRGNGQCERYNGLIWKTIQLAASTHNISLDNWENLLPVALYAIRSLLCTATNATPHERFLPFQRRSSAGTSLPSWLSQPGTVLLRRHVRHTKYEPLVDEVELIEANPQYALVRHPDGRQATVSLRDLAPAGDPKTTLEKRPDPSDTEIQPGDHRTGIAPDTLPSDDDTASVASPSLLSEELTSETLTTPDETDERSMPQKRVHPETDPDDPYSDSERPHPQRRDFGTRYFSSRTNRRARNEMSPSFNDPMQDHELPRRSQRTHKEPGHLKDFLPYE